MISSVARMTTVLPAGRITLTTPRMPTELYSSVPYSSAACLLCVLLLVSATFMWNSCLEFSAFLSLPFLRPAPTADLNSDIKPDDSPVKGTKKGKGKKEKKKAAEPFERRKPKLDELKVPASSAVLMPAGEGAGGGHIQSFKSCFLLRSPTRCTQKNWRVSLTTLRTGSTVSICSEVKVATTTTKM